MAKKGKDEKSVNYAAEVKKLKENGPERLYLLWGEEDYLLESFLKELRQVCLTEDEAAFNHHLLKGPELDKLTLKNAVDALPFFGERTLVEIREFDVNAGSDPEPLIGVLSDIPDYCTVAFVLGSEEKPKGTNKFPKFLRSNGSELHFSSQGQDQLVRWIARRFAYYKKGIELEAAQKLIFISGDLMNALIPEIEKIAAYAKGDRVTTADVMAVATHIPEADVFELTGAMAARNINEMAAVLTELLNSKDSSAILLLSLLSNQFRRILIARYASDSRLDRQFLMDACGLKYDFQVRQMLQAARGFTSEQLLHAIQKCAGADYRIKTQSVDEKELLKETVFAIASEVC